ncbi:MAG: substrate-binding domain-containing protein [Bacillota bacterium]|jgi:tungstate transport system substrate-binding protein
MRLKRILTLLLVFALVLTVLAGCGGQSDKGSGDQAQQPQEPKEKDIILATTTSTVDSGLLDILVPDFEQKTGYNVKVIAVGTGAALEMGEKGEADVLLVHAPSSEKPLVDAGIVTNYQLVMHNDFIVVGPKDDPAGVKKAASIEDAFKAVAAKKAIFVSRGDDSGTHKKEVSIWKTAGIEPSGSWYQKSGTGMGATLNIASEKQGYTLTDRATYLAQKEKLNLDIMREGDAALLNIYHVMQVNSQKFEKVNAEGAKAFVEYMINPETQKKIGEFGVDKYGQPLFIPDAGKTMDELTK